MAGDGIAPPLVRVFYDDEHIARTNAIGRRRARRTAGRLHARSFECQKSVVSVLVRHGAIHHEERPRSDSGPCPADHRRLHESTGELNVRVVSIRIAQKCLLRKCGCGRRRMRRIVRGDRVRAEIRDRPIAVERQRRHAVGERKRDATVVVGVGHDTRQ